MQHTTRTEVVAIAGIEREERLARIVRLAAAVDERLVAADDLAGVAAHEPRRALVLGDAEQLRPARQQRVREIGEALSRDDVLVDGDATQKAEALLVPRRHD